MKIERNIQKLFAFSAVLSVVVSKEKKEKTKIK